MRQLFLRPFLTISLTVLAIATLTADLPGQTGLDSYQNRQIARHSPAPRIGGNVFASFDGWDDALIRGGGQTFQDVFHDGSGLDITVRAQGTFSAEYSPGVATTYDAGKHQIGTSALSEWNQLVFQLNTNRISPSIFSPGPDGIPDYVPADLFVHTSTLGRRETVRLSSLSGESVRFDQIGSATKPQANGNGTHVVEIHGKTAGDAGNFVFSKPSSYSVTHATKSDYAFHFNQLGRVVTDPSRPLATDQYGIPLGAFPSEGIPQYAKFDGWDDTLIRSNGQRFDDVFGDGKLDVVVTSAGTYTKSVNNNQLGGTKYPHSSGGGGASGSARDIVTTAENEWNSLIYRLEPTDGGSDIGGEMFVTSSPLGDDDLVRVAALDGSPIAYSEQVAGAPAFVTSLGNHSISVNGTGDGARAGNGTFEFGASSFSLTYAAERGVGYQFFQIGREFNTLDTCIARFLSFRDGGFGSDLCDDLIESQAMSAVAVPEPNTMWVVWLGLAFALISRRVRPWNC